MTTMDEGRMENYLAGAIAAAGEAGAAVLDVYNTDFAVSYKEDRSPLTEADRESHAIILGCLNSLSPRFPVLSEEGADIPYETRRRWEYFWLVDPLDGTKEFVKRNGEFTVNIALIHKNRPVIGVVYLPVTSACYFAAEGFGAYRHVRGDAATQNPSLEVLLKNSRRLPLSLRVGGSVVVVASRSHRTGEGEAFVEELRERYDRVDLVSAGSSLKFCLVAEGTADIYPRFGPTMEWDTAAAQCVVEEAGGSVIALPGGGPLGYNKGDLRNGGFAAVSGARRDEIISIREMNSGGFSGRVQ